MLLKGRCDLPPKWEVNAQKISLSAAANARPYVPSSREGHQRHLALPFTGRGFLTHLPMGIMLEDLFKEAHEEFRRALIVLGDSRILTAAALFVLVVLLLACETPPD